MKNRCYSRYSYILCYTFSLLFLVVSFLPLFIETNEKIGIKIIYISTMLMFSVVSLVIGLYYCQFYVLEDDRIIVKWIFGIIDEIYIDNAIVEVSCFDSYFSWITTISLKWICIYDGSRKIEKFKKGFSNKKNKGRLQIIFNDYNYDRIKNKFGILDQK